MAPVNPMRPGQSVRKRRWVSGSWWLALAICPLLSGGCARTLEPTLPPPVPRLVVSPSLEATVAPWVRAYREQVEVPQFDLVPMADPVVFEAVSQGEAVLAITPLEPPPGWFATPLARESLAVVVHPSNPVRDLSLEALADLFTGRAASWSELGGEGVPVQLVVLPPGDALRQRFDAAVLNDARVWPGALIAPSPEAVIELVRRDRGAIGYLPVSQLAGSPGEVRVEGADPQVAAGTSHSSPLAFTIVATSPEEPGGAVREFLAWLQANSLIKP